MSSKNTKVAEPIIIGTEAEAKEYASKNNKEEKPKLRAIDFSLECGINDDITKPPIPDMHYDYMLRRWFPDDVEVFAITHATEFKKLKAVENAKRDAIRDTIPNLRNPGFAVPGKPLNSANEDKLANFDVASVLPSTTAPITPREASKEMEQSLQQVDQFNGTPSIPKKQSKPRSKSKVKSSKEIPDVEIVKNIIDGNISASTPTTEPGESKAPTQEPAVEQPKKTRVSQKMVAADFDSLAEVFLQVTSLGEKKPVFLPKDLRDSLEILARLSGDPRVSPSHIAINILRAFFNENRDLINRKLSSVKLSI